MDKWFDTRRLATVPRWVYVLWALFIVAVLLVIFQEMTLAFYGPRRTLYGNGVTYSTDVSRDWTGSVAYVFVPIAWFVAWTGRYFGTVVLSILILLAVLVIWSIFSQTFFYTGGGGSSWSYTGMQGKGIAASYSKGSILRFIADPAGEAYWFLNTFAILSWPVMFIIRDIQSQYYYKILGKACVKCDYSLRGTPSGLCPECGHQNPKRFKSRDR